MHLARDTSPAPERAPRHGGREAHAQHPPRVPDRGRAAARGRLAARRGSNGAGKTTLVRILSTLLAPDAGTASVHGHDVVEQPGQVRESISLTGQFAAVDEVLTGRENLVLVARLRHLADPGRVAEDLLARFPLPAAGARPAGNAAQPTEGAAAELLARRSVAQKLGLPIVGKFAGAVVVGVPPNLMGIGPAFAIPKLFEKAHITKDDVDIYEINEAFASQALFSVEHVGLPLAKVNPVGGAIAMGHPLGATGSRQIATALAEAKRTGAKLIVTSMCIGTGMGMASLIVNEQ